MSKNPKKQYDYSKLNPIFCPYCMQMYPANNVVFRKPERRAADGGVDASEYIDDKYLENYNRNFHKSVNTLLPRTIDPAYITSEDDKIYDDQSGMITAVRDVEGDHTLAQDRICPYCHNKLVRLAGTNKSHVLSVVGFKGSGKTTYEASLLHTMQMDHIGCLNVSECANPTVLDESVSRLRTNQVVNSTAEQEGPFHYQVTFNKPGAENFLLNMVDLPGEYFRDVNTIRTTGYAIPNSDTCIFLVDIDNLVEAIYVLGSLIGNYASQLSSGKVNVAVVLYKADKLLNKFPKVPEFLTFRQHRGYSDCAPVDMERVKRNHEDILRYVVEGDPSLGSLHTALKNNVPENNLRWFAAFSMQNDKYEPNNVEEPLLWSLALKGMYPSV